MLATPPVLTHQLPNKVIYLYINVSKEVISDILITNPDSIHKSVYLISKALAKLKIRYQKTEKEEVALVISLRKL